MVQAERAYSVDRERAARRWLNVAGATALLGYVLLCGGLIARGLSPVVPLLALIAGAATLAIAWVLRHPELGLYGIIGIALIFEEFSILGLPSFTADTYLYSTLAFFTPLPLPIRVIELFLLVALGATLVSALARTGPPIYRGGLFIPAMLLAAAVIAAMVWGMVGGLGASPFSGKIAWVEGRGLLYLVVAYVLASTLLTNRRRIDVAVWLFVALVGVKGLQGVVRFIAVARRGDAVETIIAHEDVIVLSAFLLLAVSVAAFGGDRRLRVAIFLLLPPVAFTLLASRRRLGIIVFLVGALVVGAAMLRAKPVVVLKALPVLAMLLVIYCAAFWNASGPLGEPIRAVRSQFVATSEEDRLSNEFRRLENINIEANIRSAPITGIGLGRQYTFAVEQPDLDRTGFLYWRYITHNSIFWIWMKLGLPGFLIFWYLIGSAIARGLITFRRLPDGTTKAVALVVVASVVMFVLFAYGDVGITLARPMILMGCLLGLLVRLPGADTVEEAAAP
jgi:O-antigen ligase